MLGNYSHPVIKSGGGGEGVGGRQRETEGKKTRG